MNKLTDIRFYFWLLLGILLPLAGCDENGGDEPEPPPPPLNIEVVRGQVTDINGNTYGTVFIGSQEWMAENLRATTYADGVQIEYPGADNALWVANTTGAYAWYNNEQSNKDLYGAVYNWHAVSTNRLCPSGWRVPRTNDWLQLIEYMRVEYSLSNESGALGGVGNRLKLCRQLRSPLGAGCATTAHPRWHNHDRHYGFDDFGFAALPVGNRNSEGGYISNAGFYGHWWTASGNGPDHAFGYYITYDNGALFQASSAKVNGYAVRCVR
jgi:uncharacterized protein (TIGR02145 family)